MAAELRADTVESPAFIVEAGYKLNPNWALFGDVWARPMEGQVGGDLAARWKSNVDFYAGGWANTDGEAAAHAGVKWRF